MPYAADYYLIFSFYSSPISPENQDLSSFPYRHPSLLHVQSSAKPRPIPLLTWVLNVSADESRHFQEYFLLGKSPEARVDSLSSAWPRAPKTLTEFRSCLEKSFLSPLLPLPVPDFPEAKPGFFFSPTSYLASPPPQ